MGEVKNYSKEVRWLLKEKYKWEDLKVHDFFNHKIPSKKVPSKIKKDLDRILKGEPIDYVIGWTEFLVCKIAVNKNVLIPRPETEYWVDNLVRRYKRTNVQNLNVLDLCCGSGCIGIGLLQLLSDSFVTFVDISEDVLEVTRKNVEDNRIEDRRYQVIKADLFDNIHKKHDLIVCNPPYVSYSETNPDLKWEPKEALYAEKEGLGIIERVIKEAPNFLEKKGELWLEFGKGQEEKIKKLLECSKFNSFSFHKDQYSVIRYFVAVNSP